MQNPTDYVRGLYVRLQLSVDFMTSIRPFVANKEPPFALDPALKNDLDYYLKKTLELINNSFEGVFDSMSNLMNYVIEATIAKQEVTYRRTLWLYCYILIFCLLAYLTFCIIQSLLINRKLFRIMTIFRLLKQEDMDLLKDITAENQSILHSNKFNEVALLQAYLDHTLSSQIAAAKPVPKSKVGSSGSKHKIGGFYRRQHGTVRIKDDRYFGISKMMFAFNFIIVFALTLLLVLMMNIGLDMINTIEVEKLYHENYLKFIPVSNNYLSFINLLIFGNYVKIDGKYPEEYEDYKSIQKFNEFWIRKPYSDFLQGKENDSLNEILFNDICIQLTTASSNQATVKRICESYIPAQKGLIGILISEDNEIAGKRAEIKLSQKQAFLDKSKGQIQLTPNTDYYFSKEFLKLRLVHEATVDLLIQKLFTLMDNMLTTTFSDTLDSISSKQLTTYLFMFAVLVVYVAFSAVFLRRDTRICFESYLCISPAVLYKNPSLVRAFDLFFYGKQR